MDTPNTLLWQPKRLDALPYVDIEVSREFIKQTLDLRITAQGVHLMNELARRELKKYRCNPGQPPFMFFENSYCAMQFNIDNDGRWFSSKNPTYGKSLLEVYSEPKNIVYSGHNIDYREHTLAMMRLTDIWTEYFDIIQKEYHQ